MAVTKYYTNGALDDPTGLTLSVQEFDDDGNLTFGLVNGDGKPEPGYLAKEISKEEFDKIALDIKDPSIPNGMAGLISEEFATKQAEKHAEARKARSKQVDVSEVEFKLAELGIDRAQLKALLNGKV